MSEQLDFSDCLGHLLAVRALEPRRLAGILGVSDDLVSAWLNGTRLPPIASAYLNVIADALSLSEQEEKQLRDSCNYSRLQLNMVKLGIPRSKAQEASWLVIRNYTRIAQVRRRMTHWRARKRTEPRTLYPGDEIVETVFTNMGRQLQVFEVSYYGRLSIRIKKVKLVILPGRTATVIAPKWWVSFRMTGQHHEVEAVTNHYDIDQNMKRTLKMSTRNIRSYSFGLNFKLPVLVKNHNGYNSKISIMNATKDRLYTSAIIEFNSGHGWIYNGSERSVAMGTHICHDLRPSDGVTVDLNDIDWLPDGFFGSGRVISTRSNDKKPQSIVVYVKIDTPSGRTYDLDVSTESQEIAAIIRTIQRSK